MVGEQKRISSEKLQSLLDEIDLEGDVYISPTQTLNLQIHILPEPDAELTSSTCVGYIDLQTLEVYLNPSPKKRDN